MRNVRLLGCTALLLAVVGCAGKGSDAKAESSQAAAPGGAAALTEFELEHGIGPVKTAVELGPVDQALVTQGKAAFEARCTACHKLSEKYVGPELGEVTTRRSPTYIMNMILNPQEMIERHPVAKKLLAEHMTYMANQGASQDEARAIVEYLRTQAKGTVRTK